MNEKIETLIDQIVSYNPVLGALHNQLVADNAVDEAYQQLHKNQQYPWLICGTDLKKR